MVTSSNKDGTGGSETPNLTKTFADIAQEVSDVSARIRMDDEKALEGHHAHGSTSISSGKEARGNSADQGSTQQNKENEKDRRYQQLLSSVQLHINALRDQAREWERLAAEAQVRIDGLQKVQDKDFRHMEEAQELMDDFKRTGTLDQDKARALFAKHGTVLPKDADDATLYTLLEQHHKKMHGETQERQKKIDHQHEVREECREHARESRKIIDELEDPDITDEKRIALSKRIKAQVENVPASVKEKDLKEEHTPDEALKIQLDKLNL